MPDYIVSIQGANAVAKSASNPFSSALLPISLKQAYHEGKQFMAILEKACDYFNTIYISIGDHIYKYTLQILGMTENEAILTAEKMGEDWYKTVAQDIKTLSLQKNVTIYVRHWKAELNNEGFNEYENKINSLYNTNKVFRNGIDAAASQFLQHLINKNKNQQNGFDNNFIGYDAGVELARKYLKNELAVFLTWPNKYKSNIFLYPFEHNPVGKWVKEAAIIASAESAEVNKMMFINITIIPNTKKQKKNQIDISEAANKINYKNNTTTQSSYSSLFGNKTKKIPSPMEQSPPGSPPRFSDERHILDYLLEKAREEGRTLTRAEIETAMIFLKCYNNFIESNKYSDESEKIVITDPAVIPAPNHKM